MPTALALSTEAEKAAALDELVAADHASRARRTPGPR